jgi:hypothetical protein
VSQRNGMYRNTITARGIHDYIIREYDLVPELHSDVEAQCVRRVGC